MLPDRAEIATELKKFAADGRAQASQSVNQLVVVGATLLIGVVVLAQISGAMPDVSTTDFDGTMGEINDILVSSFELGAILPLVIIAGALLFFVMRFGSMGNGGRR